MKQQPARGKPADYGQLILQRRARLVRQQLQLSAKRILDFGCGNGAQTIEFADSGASILAMDIDQKDLDHFKARLAEKKIESIRTLHYDGNTLPLDTSSLDIVLSFEVLEHVGNEERALEEIHRVLKPDGDLLMSVPNKWWIFETHGAYLPWLPWNRVPFFSWLPKSIHSRFAKARIYRKKDLRRLLQNQGFQIKSMQYITAPMDMLSSRRLQAVLRKTVFKGDVTRFPFLSTAILVHAKKSPDNASGKKVEGKLVPDDNLPGIKK